MDYKVYKLYDSKEFPRLTEGIRIAKCMGSNTLDVLERDLDAEILNKLEDLSVSEKLFCSFCNTSFEDQTQQRSHYKLDWHRYNLKQKLAGLKSVTEEGFSQLADGVSSISGSESESEDDGCEDSILTSASKLNAHQSEESDHLRSIAIRHAKIFFENSEGNILSFYRCLLHGKKEVPEIDDELIPLVLKIGINPVWAVIMLGGGHFAAAIFQGENVLVHKTFHCYTVRAKQGGGQSSRDSRSGGSHPKSAGASLRRYNEAALIQHVQEIMDSWSSHLSSCDLILYRAVGHNRNVLFSGKNPPLTKTDPRLRSVPFATRRATFSEVKRIHDVLTNIEVYGSADFFKTMFPKSPRKRGERSQGRSDQSEERSRDEIDSDAKSSTKNSTEQTGAPVKKQKDKKPEIDRAKARKSPERPLPGVSLLSRSSSGSEVNENYLICEDAEISFDCLREYEDTVPQKIKDRKRNREKKNSKKQKNQMETDVCPAAVRDLKSKLWTACRKGDTNLLIATLQIEGDVTEEDRLQCLNENVGDSKETLLHVAAQEGHQDIMRALLEAGCDPCVKNKKLQTPYVVSLNKETRNIFRKFWADFPDKYDYTKSQIAGPLTDDMEQKQAEKRRELRKVKKEREKERKKEEVVRREEEAEKERFLKLSDREKRALAAERRLVSQASVGSVKLVVSRCFLCALDMTGQVPFEYDTYRFCSINCLKAHRLKVKNKVT